MRLRRCLASTAFLVLLGSPTAVAAPVPTSPAAEVPPGDEQVELTGVPDRIRPAVPVELTATMRNAGPAPLLLEPEVSIGGDRGIAPEQVRLEVLDPVGGTWVLRPLGTLGSTALPFPGAAAITETSGRLAPGATVDFRLRFTIAANVPTQFVQVSMGGRSHSPNTGDEPRFTRGFAIDAALLGPDGGAPTRPPSPDETRPPSVPNAGPDRSGGVARMFPTARRGDGPTFNLVGVPGRLQAGGGAAEFKVTFTNDTGRIIPGVRPEVVFTTGQSPITPRQLVVEVYDSYDRGWSPVSLRVLTDPANGRDAHLAGVLTPKPWDGQRQLPPGEFATISLRVSIPDGSPVAGGDLAVLAGGAAPNGVGPDLSSRSDYQVLHVPNPGGPTRAPTLRPELPPTAPDSAAGQRREDHDDTFTFATVAIWVTLAVLGGTIVHFARKNRRQGAGTPLGPDA
ncbi:hypothetical protein [Embleya hyalina]|uniref:Uncharacterized protein n=1 Tax=Embleya hyalina TaxID=516124 RepID=A0A401YNX0_9ACTN|nr:hypothetical protein [Embleya hyalina]GCD96255.1 hypothetical protein EHYA_03940 [Embleya hyalina]